MAIDLQNSQNIATGWGAPPKFDAPAIGSTLSAILENRRVQQALQQKQIADAVKQIQEQRQQDAYASALRDTGLSEGQDLSGVSSADQTRIAQLLQARTPDTQRNALLEAQTRLYNAKADEPYATSAAPAGVSYDEHSIGDTWISDDGLRMVMTRMGPKLAPVGLQPSDQRTQNENQMLKEQAGLLESKGQMDADKKRQEAEDRAAGNANVPYKLSDQYNRTVNRLKQLQQSRVIPSTQPDAVPQDAPAETGDELPTTQPTPTVPPKFLRRPDTVAPRYLRPPPSDSAGGHAETYGVQGVKMQAPDGTVKTVSPDQVDYYKTKGAVVVP